MTLRLRNPIGPLTREQKLALGIGAGALLAIGTLSAIAWASSGDPAPVKRALEVGDACSTFAVTSDQKLRDDLRARLRSAAKRGPIDPLQITAQYLSGYAPQCPTYPANVQNPGQVKLFAAVYTTLLDVMQQENFLSSGDFPTWYNMMTTWAAGQGVPAEEL